MPMTKVPSGERRRAIVVSGMHRSGTSALARVLSLVGADLPKTLMPPALGNDPGHWESLPVARLHDELLDSVGVPWHDVLPFPSGWYGTSDARQFVERMRGIVLEEFDESPLFVVKDPRLCRLVPFWLTVLGELDVLPAFLIPIRNPLEVADSLRERDGLSISHGLLLWLRCVLDVELQTRGHARAFVSYARLLDDWEGAVRPV